MPVQIWDNPFWVQLIADTLPRMAFASAWTLLVSFFIQLVGVASGSYHNSTIPQSSSTSSPSSLGFFKSFFYAGGSSWSTTPGIVVMQWTAYSTYAMLVATYLISKSFASAVLLYALLCCIYATLLGTSLYFGPKLCLLLQPTLTRHSGLTVRLGASTVLCIVVFAAETYGMARRVVAPPNHGVSWWWQYGVLELIPATLCLVMMHTHRMTLVDRSNNKSGGSGDAPSGGIPVTGTPPLATRHPASSSAAAAAASSSILSGNYRRTDSHGSVNRTASGGGRSPVTNNSGSGGSESSPLLRTNPGCYGAAVGGGNDN